MTSWQRLRWMIYKESRQFRRNPALLRMAVLMPLMQTIVLSYAANFDVTRVPLVFCDQSQTPQSRELIARLVASSYFSPRPAVHDEAALQQAIDRGQAALGLLLPPTLSRDLVRGKATALLLVDGSDSNTATVAATYVVNLAAAWERGLRFETMQRRGLRRPLPSVDLRSRVLYNSDLRSLWLMAPAVLALVLTVLMQGLTSLSIARERELGTLEQLVMTPLRPSEIMLGKLLPYALVGCGSATLVTGFVVLVLHVPLRGSPVVMITGIGLFLAATLGIGLVVSTFSANQQQAQLGNFFLSFPSMLLSGFMFPTANLPQALQVVSAVVPMTHFLEVSRGVYLRGSGFEVLWPRLLALAGLATLFFTIGALRFRKRLD
ncbi:MAG: ABC transporter permease [Fimbriimonadaceae bacterium]|nr:ABC transporter permease [Fimbriimonadaceae bacterium]